MLLFRQEVFGDWKAPFDRIKARLKQETPQIRMVS
jgi:hypothetical protein